MADLIYHLKGSELVNPSHTECVYLNTCALPVVTVVIMVIVSIFIANQLMVLSILIRLIVQVVNPENTNTNTVQDDKYGVGVNVSTMNNSRNKSVDVLQTQVTKTICI